MYNFTEREKTGMFPEVRLFRKGHSVLAKAGNMYFTGCAHGFTLCFKRQ